MFALIKDNAIAQLVQAGTAFDWDDVQYPANWCNLSTPEEKAAIGMVDVVYAPMPSDQYYWVSQNEPVYADGVVTVGYTATAKDLAACQNSAVSQVRQTTYSILLPSDWMVVRATETRSATPTDWNDWRQTIRTQAAGAIDAIAACKDVDQLAALPQVAWAHDPDYVAPQETK